MPASSLPQLLVFALAAAAACTLLALMLRSRWRDLLTDRPNERSLHDHPRPRFGGIALLGAALGVSLGAVATVQPGWNALPALVAGALALTVLGVLDDLRPIAIATRLAVHGAVAAAFVALLGDPLSVRLAPSGAFSLIVVGTLWLAIAWSINLYNFMDGSDGLAGGMTLIGFGAYALAAPAGTALAMLSWAIAGAATGFLLFNWPPARLFMGDGGSIPLGFLAAGVGTAGWVEAYWPAWFGPLVFAPFAVDATATLAARALRGAPLWRAHREHAYQKLNLLGLGHGGTLAAYLALMLSCAAAALLGRALPDTPAALMLIAVGLVLLACYLAVDRAWRRQEAAPSGRRNAAS